MRVLVVDDERQVRDAVERALELDGYDVAQAEDGYEALRQVGAEPPDVVVLDVSMPALDGLQVCRRLRAEGDRTPILMLTARDAIGDRVSGLDAGADDYLVKPFAMEELVARLHALGRRGRDERDRLVFADLVLELSTRTAQRGGRPVSLTARESALLELLLRNAQVVVSRERAIEEIWQEAAVPNVVDRYVTRLRRKLGEPPLIRTVVGRGYRLCDHD